MSSVGHWSASWKSEDGVSDQFPADLRVVFVDDDDVQYCASQVISPKISKKSKDKKPQYSKVVWTIQMHQHFLNAVNQLGIHEAIPEEILKLMNNNVPGLTQENVASHLQKYRLYLKKLSGQQQNGLLSGATYNIPSMMSSVGPGDVICHMENPTNMEPRAFGSMNMPLSTPLQTQMVQQKLAGLLL